MIPNYQDRKIESSGVLDTAAFGISMEDSAHVMTMLRDTVYSDKVLAVIREYSANAWDAHQMVGKAHLPIKVVLPTQANPNLIIQDFGPGLSHEDVCLVYTQYGKSTKRSSNSAVGQLGIGSKSGFSYSDTFSIISKNGGKSRTYVAVLDETEKGHISLLDETDCGEETGITIQIPIKNEDIAEFAAKAEALFQFFDPRPDINIALPPAVPVQMRLKSGLIFDDDTGGSWQAVMGCIPYRINLSQLNITKDQDDKTGIGQWVNKLSGVLYFNIGEVHVAISREDLKYSRSTKQVIVARFTELVDEFVQNTLTAIEQNSINSWDRRLRAQILRKFDLPVPDSCKGLVQSYIEIQKDPADCAKTFSLVNKDKSQTNRHFNIGHDTRVMLCDDPRKPQNFKLGYYDYLLIPNEYQADPNNPDTEMKQYTWEEVLPELDAWLLKNKLDGVPIAKLSEQTWTPPFVKQKIKKIVNPKYQRRSFTLREKSYYGHPFSNGWDATDTKRIATDEDVFVLLEGFRSDTHSGFDIYRTFVKDKNIAEFFGYKMPPVYGYKTTAQKPLKVSDCVGQHYPEWRKTFLKKVIDEKAGQYLRTHDWQRIYRSRWDYIQLDSYRLLKTKLGKDHPIVTVLSQARKASKLWNRFSRDRQTVCIDLGEVYYSNLGNISEAKTAVDALYVRYPLLSLSSIRIDALWGDGATQWMEYVQLIDRTTPLNLVVFTPVPEDEKDDINE